MGRGLDTRRVAKYTDFGPIDGCVSETVQDIVGKLVLITNRKSYMSFRFVPKSVTLNDLERRSGPYSALFHRIHVNDVVVKSPRSPSHLLVSFLYTVQTDKSSAAA